MADLKNTMAAIAVHQSKIEQNERMAENLLRQIEPQLCGRRVEQKFAGKLSGIYEITRVRLSYNAAIEARARKVLANGALGSQEWDIGTVQFERLLPCE